MGRRRVARRAFTKTREVPLTIAIRKPSLGSAATSYLAQQHKLLIDGKWVAAATSAGLLQLWPAARGEPVTLEKPGQATKTNKG